MPLLTPQGRTALKKYKYSGQDQSLVNKYVLRHYWDACMLFVPKWLAPNLITLSGLFLVVFAQYLMYTESPHLNQPLSGSVLLFGGFAVFGYQTLDNLDGRQARLTGTSSPLGHMFDHCLDCINIMLTGVNVATVFEFGPSLMAFLSIWIGGFLPFFYATYEEYVTGTMILPWFNGPVEGLLMVVSVHLLTFAFGRSIWFIDIPLPINLEPITDSFQSRHLIVFISFLMALVTIFFNTATILRHTRLVKRNILWPMLNIAAFWVWTFSVIIWILNSPTKVMENHPRLLIWTVGLAFADCINNMILAHLTHNPSFTTWRLTGLPVVLLAWNSVAGIFLDDTPLLYAYFVFIATTVAYFAFQIVTEVTALLGIKCFSIPVKK